MEELTTIYKDNETEISISTAVVSYLKLMNKFYFRISQQDIQTLVDLCFHKIFNLNQMNFKNYSVVTSSTIPRLFKGDYIELNDYAAIFEDAVFILSQHFNRTDFELTREEKDDIEDAVLQHYQDQYGVDCVLHIFDKEYKNVSGYMSITDDKKIYIFFFNLCYEDLFEEEF